MSYDWVWSSFFDQEFLFSSSKNIVHKKQKALAMNTLVQILFIQILLVFFVMYLYATNVNWADTSFQKKNHHLFLY